MQKIMLIYPPGKRFQRGENRYQTDIENSEANSNSACNDLGYAAAILKRANYTVFLRDYQGENLRINHLMNDLKKENPEVVFISTTNEDIYNDLKTVSKIKKFNNNIVIILKGTLFFNPEEKLFQELEAKLDEVDYLIGGETEFIIEPLVKAHYNNKNQLKDIQGISYKEDNKWISNYLVDFCEDLDSLPFPDRSLMKNELYKSPVTNRPLAIITTSKGCCFDCFYCLSSVISGKNIRNRSNKSILEEITECYKKYNIKNFFFKSDTFTVDKNRVIELCNMLINSELNGKITWHTTSRADTLDDEMLKIMKKAGCSMLSIGFESGSNESLKKMKKGTTTENNRNAAKLCKKNKIKVIGHFLIGFDWEDENHLESTKKHIFDLNVDFIDISIISNKDHKIPVEKLQKYRKKILREFYFRPKYIMTKFFEIKTPAILFNYIKFVIKLL